MKIRILIFFLLGSVLAISSCKSKSKIQKVNNDTVKYYLYKGMCYGTCPSYELSIYEGGKAVFNGLRYTKREGEFTKYLSPATFSKLEQAFARSKFDTYKAEYESRIPDLPLIKVGYHNGVENKMVEGREDRPEAIMNLQKMLEDIADSDGWTASGGKLVDDRNVKDDRTRKDDVNVISNEVMIEIDPDLFLPAWIKDRSKMGVKLLRQVSPNSNLYLISYDTDKVNPDSFMSMLRADDMIKNASFNKKVELRGGR